MYLLLLSVSVDIFEGDDSEALFRIVVSVLKLAINIMLQNQKIILY